MSIAGEPHLLLGHVVMIATHICDGKVVCAANLATTAPVGIRVCQFGVIQCDAAWAMQKRRAYGAS